MGNCAGEMVKRVKHAARWLAGWGVGLWFVVTGKRKQGLARYDEKGTILSVFSHYPTAMVNRKVLTWLLREGFKFVSTDEMLTWNSVEDMPEGRIAWLTFDDGWASMKENVLPFLTEQGIPATIFVAPEDGANKGPLLSQAEISELAKTNKLLTFENHTLTHCKCDKVIAEENGTAKLADEIACARERIGELTGRSPKLMCYPYGRWNEATEEIVKGTGLVAVRSNPGVMRAGQAGEYRNLYYNDMSFLENSCRVAGAWMKIKSGGGRQ